MKKTNAYFSDLKMWSNMTQYPSPQFKWHDGKEIIYQHILSQIYCHNSFGEIMFQYYKKNKMHYIEISSGFPNFYVWRRIAKGSKRHG